MTEKEKSVSNVDKANCSTNVRDSSWQNCGEGNWKEGDKKYNHEGCIEKSEIMESIHRLYASGKIGVTAKDILIDCYARPDTMYSITVLLLELQQEGKLMVFNDNSIELKDAELKFFLI